MCSARKLTTIVSMLMAALALTGLAAQEQKPETMPQAHAPRGQGRDIMQGGMMPMIGMMQQMSQMMETCNKMMQAHMAQMQQRA